MVTKIWICKWHNSIFIDEQDEEEPSSFFQTLDPNLEEEDGNGKILFSASHISRRKRYVSNHAHASNFSIFSELWFQ